MRLAYVVAFRRRPLAPRLWSDGRVQTTCTEHVHLFEDVPGRCHCGAHVWDAIQPAAEEAGEQRKETS